MLRRSRSPQKALALLGVMLLLFFVGAIALVTSLYNGRSGDISTVTKQGLLDTRRRTEITTARALAESGFSMAWQWLNALPTSPTLLRAFAPSETGTSFYGATSAGGYDVLTVSVGPTASENPDAIRRNGTISVRFYPSTENAVTNRKAYCIEVIGTVDGVRQIARAYVRRKTFAYYAYFVNQMTDLWFLSGRNHYSGPVHINAVDASGTAVDPLAHLQFVWRSDNPVTDRIFLHPGDDYLTTSAAASQFVWQLDSGGLLSPSSGPSGAQWSYFALAAKAPKTGVAIIPFPVSSSEQEVAARGGLAAPSAFGVTIPDQAGQTKGGVYINGDVSRLRLRATGTDSIDQTIEVYQNDGTQDLLSTVVLDRNNNQTTVRVQSSATGANLWTTIRSMTYSGATNGLIYINGSVQSCSGTIANSKVDTAGQLLRRYGLTVATAANCDLGITGGLVYANLVTDATNTSNIRSSATTATAQSGIFGLISRHIHIATTDDSGLALTELAVHGTTLAYQTFDADAHDTRPLGTTILLGGYIAGASGAFGTFDSTTGVSSTGFESQRVYDERVPDSPPPYFPLAGNFYQQTSFQWVKQTL